ncbi:MAG TPA: alkaline phosphatase family protein [Acetobacteraceae bacterium]|jgi:phospholipase C|nr:alkaline phosphatase family protein [Acetobacteraceae bacterium]
MAVFAHAGTASGYVNNSPTHFPYEMETVFNRLSDANQEWRIYFHDMLQTATLARIWGDMFTSLFLDFSDFVRAAGGGNLPAYSFIEPRYFSDLFSIPNDEHPPHNVAYGEQLIAAVYNTVRGGPGWKQTLLVITYDEHGGFPAISRCVLKFGRNRGYELSGPTRAESGISPWGERGSRDGASSPASR